MSTCVIIKDIFAQSLTVLNPDIETFNASRQMGHKNEIILSVKLSLSFSVAYIVQCAYPAGQFFVLSMFLIIIYVHNFVFLFFFR